MSFSVTVLLAGCGGGGGGNASSPSPAQESSVNGRVVDSSAEGVPEAVVAIDGFQVSDSDTQGNFSFTANVGTHTLVISKDGIPFIQIPITVNSLDSQDLGDVSPTTQYFQALETWHRDNDGDGYSSGETIVSNIQIDDYFLFPDLISTELDCNDSSITIYPGADDICGNGIDEDCSGYDDVCISKIGRAHV